MSTAPKPPRLDSARIAELVRELNGHRKRMRQIIEHLQSLGVSILDVADRFELAGERKPE
jgi:hypothetical protein